VDLIIINGNVIPMTSASEHEEAIAVQNGKIAKVGTSLDIERLRNPGTRVVDARGKTVLPGFIDTHVHLTQTGLSLESAQLDKAASVSEVCDLIHERALKTPPGGWVYGNGCVHWTLREKRFPTMKELDRISEGHPVFITSATYHSGVANSAAFRVIDPDVNLEGVEKDRSTGEPTGLFSTDDTFFEACRKAYSQLSDEEITGLIRAAARFAAGRGVTTLHCLDGQFISGDRDVYTLQRIHSTLPIHTLLLFQTMDVPAALGLGLPRIGGCLTIDGAGPEHTALFYEPYDDAPETCGRLFIPESEIRSFIQKAHRAGLQIAMHAIGDRAIDILVGAYKEAMEAFPREDCRHRVEHFTIPTDWAIEQAAALRLALPMNPAHMTFWGPPADAAMERRLGKKRVDRAYPFVELCRRGLKVSGGSDSPVTPIDPLMGIHAAVNSPREPRRVSVEEALRIFTVNGAWAGREEESKGTIEQGKWADFVILDRDPFQDPEHIDEFRIEMTMAKGKIVYSAADQKG